MARKLRFIPDPHTLVSITGRTVQGRFLFKPGAIFNDRLLGILGRAQRRHNITLIAISVLSNHFHILAVPESIKQLAACLTSSTTESRWKWFDVTETAQSSTSQSRWAFPRTPRKTSLNSGPGRNR